MVAVVVVVEVVRVMEDVLVTAWSCVVWGCSAGAVGDDGACGVTSVGVGVAAVDRQSSQPIFELSAFFHDGRR